MRISVWSSDVCSSDLPEARMEAMRGLWEDAETPVQRHARHILTASAAARMVPSEALAGDTEDLIASMLTADDDERARPEERLVGKGWVRTWRYRLSAYQ